MTNSFREKESLLIGPFAASRIDLNGEIPPGKDLSPEFMVATRTGMIQRTGDIW